MNYYDEYFPDNVSSGSEIDENRIIKYSKKKKLLSADDFCIKYSDDLWYLWNVIHDYSITTGLCNRLSYATFCVISYENSTKY